MTFAIITPALIIGSLAERMKFSAVFVFILLWVTFIYFPIAHGVWYWAGPDAIGDAANALADAPDDAAKEAAQANLHAVLNTAAFSINWGRSISPAAPWSIQRGHRRLCWLPAARQTDRLSARYRAAAFRNHDQDRRLLLWVGSFGFNAGSNLESNGMASLAFVNTMVATAAATLGSMSTEWTFKGKPPLLGMVSGAVAGLVAVTPASGFAGPMGSIVIGLVAGAVGFSMCAYVKKIFRLRRRPRCFRCALYRRHHSGRSAPVFWLRPTSAAPASPTTSKTPAPPRVGITTWRHRCRSDEERAFHTFWSGIGWVILYKSSSISSRPQADEASGARRPRRYRRRRAGV